MFFAVTQIANILFSTDIGNFSLDLGNLPADLGNFPVDLGNFFLDLGSNLSSLVDLLSQSFEWNRHYNAVFIKPDNIFPIRLRDPILAQTAIPVNDYTLTFRYQFSVWTFRFRTQKKTASMLSQSGEKGKSHLWASMLAFRRSSFCLGPNLANCRYATGQLPFPPFQRPFPRVPMPGDVPHRFLNSSGISDSNSRLSSGP